MKRSYARTAAVLGALIAVWSVLIGTGAIDDVYAHVFGPAVHAPVDFATLTRRSSPNDALACPPEVCLKARIDVVPPVYRVGAERLRAIVAEVAEAEPRTRPAWANDHSADDHQDSYGARSRLLRFPDTIDVKVIPLGEDSSTVAIYSRSGIGYWDFGVNRARVERWLERIRVLVSEEPAISEG